MTTEIRDTAIRHGQLKKRKNALSALVCGALPAALLELRFHPAWPAWLLGLTIGMVWGNAFEYVYHRLLLHRPRTPLGAVHQEHHTQIGTPQQAEFVALISSPLNILLLFVINGIPAALIAWLLGLQGILCGIFVGWSLYVILCEEIHWRIHMDGWLPPGLQFVRAYHMSHHDIPNSRYNVFLPLFDFIFRSSAVGKGKLSAPRT